MPPTWPTTRLSASSAARWPKPITSANARTWPPSPVACASTTGAAANWNAPWLQTLAERPEARQPSPEQRAIIVETLYEVDTMLARLPKKVSEAFLLAHLHGLPYKQIAVQLGVCERMVKKYMAQALLHCAILEAELDGMLVQ